MRLTLCRWAATCRQMSTAVAASPGAQPSHFRTVVDNPLRQSSRDEGLLYALDRDDQQRLFQVTGIRRPQLELSRTLGELGLMVRSPALHIINCLQSCDASRPANRFVLYGWLGAGKTCSMQHVLHAGLRQDRVLVHFPELDRWGLRFRDVAPCSYDPKLIDHPLDAMLWLTHFRSQNSPLLARLALTCSEEYVWSQRETTERGAPLTDLVELGISRGKLASRCMSVLLQELRRYASEGRCRLLVAVERVNALWSPDSSIVKREDKSRVSYLEFAALQGLLPLLRNDWRGGDVVCTVCPLWKTEMDSYMPRHLLGEEGWTMLDPFVPVRVDYFSRREAYNMIDYLTDLKWLQNPESYSEEGKKQLYFLSCGNGRRLMELCQCC